MNRLLRSVVLAAAGLAVASLYRQSKLQRAPSRHRLPLESWENEGGAVPDSTPLDAGPDKRSSGLHW